jgi:hypothetical protein
VPVVLVADVSASAEARNSLENLPFLRGREAVDLRNATPGLLGEDRHLAGRHRLDQVAVAVPGDTPASRSRVKSQAATAMTTAPTSAMSRRFGQRRLPAGPERAFPTGLVLSYSWPARAWDAAKSASIFAVSVSMCISPMCLSAMTPWRSMKKVSGTP